MPEQTTKTKVTKANVSIIAEMLMWMLLYTFGVKAITADRQKWHEIDEWVQLVVGRRYTFGYSVTSNDLLREVMHQIDDLTEKGEAPHVSQ